VKREAGDDEVFLTDPVESSTAPATVIEFGFTKDSVELTITG